MRPFQITKRNASKLSYRGVDPEILSLGWLTFNYGTNNATTNKYQDQPRHHVHQWIQFYFGIKAAGWNDCLWLNPCTLTENLLKENQSVVGVKYFTSRITDNPKELGKRKRQSTFIEALQATPLTDVYFGQFQARAIKCHHCSTVWQTFDEKMTDVNIATQLLCDAFEDSFDTALIVSGDSDLTPPIEAIRARFPHKKLIVVFPPKRHSVRLATAANASFQLGRKLLKDSQFSDEYPKADGYILKRPSTWN